MANYDDDLMEDAEETQPPQRVRSQVNAVRKQKGRGFREGMDVDDDRHAGRGYESLESGTGPGPAKCANAAPACFFCPCWKSAGLVFPRQYVAVLAAGSHHRQGRQLVVLGAEPAPVMLCVLAA